LVPSLLRRRLEIAANLELPAFQGATDDGRLLSDYFEVSSRSRVWLPAALLPLLQGALADVISARELCLRHFHALANSFDVHGLGPDLLQLDLAALVSDDELHGVDQVGAEGTLLGAAFSGQVRVYRNAVGL
jgi:hypothetical protein